MSKAEDDAIEALLAPPPPPPLLPVLLPGTDHAQIRESVFQAIGALAYATRATKVYGDRARYERSVAELSTALAKLNKAPKVEPLPVVTGDNAAVESAIGGQ